MLQVFNHFPAAISKVDYLSMFTTIGTSSPKSLLSRLPTRLYNPNTVFFFKVYFHDTVFHENIQGSEVSVPCQEKSRNCKEFCTLISGVYRVGSKSC